MAKYLHIQAVSSRINHYFSDISNNSSKKCFEQKLVSFRFTIHLNIKNIQKFFPIKK